MKTHPLKELFEAIEAYIDVMDPDAMHDATDQLYRAMSKMVPTDEWARSPWEPNFGDSRSDKDILKETAVA